MKRTWFSSGKDSVRRSKGHSHAQLETPRIGLVEGGEALVHRVGMLFFLGNVVDLQKGGDRIIELIAAAEVQEARGGGGRRGVDRPAHRAGDVLVAVRVRQPRRYRPLLVDGLQVK